MLVVEGYAGLPKRRTTKQATASYTNHIYARARIETAGLPRVLVGMAASSKVNTSTHRVGAFRVRGIFAQVNRDNLYNTCSFDKTQRLTRGQTASW